MTTQFVVLSDHEQKAEAVRAIVTAQHELEAMPMQLENDYFDDAKEFPTTHVDEAYERMFRAANWLSLVA